MWKQRRLTFKAIGWLWTVCLCHAFTVQMFIVEAKCFDHYCPWLCFRTKSDTVTTMDIMMTPKLPSVRNKWADITWLLTGWSSIRSKAWPNQTALWVICTDYLTVIPVMNPYVESVYLFVCLCLSTALGFIMETISPCVSNGDEVRLQFLFFFFLFTPEIIDVNIVQNRGWDDMMLPVLYIWTFDIFLNICLVVAALWSVLHHLLLY